MIFEKVELEEGEIVLRVIRRHWFVLFKQALFSLFLVVMPLFVFILTTRLGVTSLSAYTPHLLFLLAFWLLVQWMFLAYAWTDQYLDIWAITNRRIITVDQIRLFRRQVGSFRLERLQDITIEINGFFATFLDFGTIHTETASGSENEFRAMYMPHPQEIKALILKAVDERMGNTPSL